MRAELRAGLIARLKLIVIAFCVAYTVADFIFRGFPLMVATAASPSACQRCQQDARQRRQIYSVEGELGTYVFDVTLARHIVRDDKHQAHLVPPELLTRMLEVNAEYEELHLDHVDPKIPGILGQRFGGIALIDGTHRGYRCLRDKLPFYAFMLDIEESMRCLAHSEPVDFTPEMMAKELRGMLGNNPQVEMMTTVLDATDDEGDSADVEKAVRSFLTAEQNARVTIQVRRKE
jgi:hypothetical protein